MTAKGQPGSGINVANCKDVIDELVDLLADTAFEEEDAIEPMDEPAAPPTSLGRTHRELTATMKDCNTQLFTGIIRDQGTKNWELGPKARPGDIVLAILNIFRNLSCVFDNRKTLAQHPRFLDVILRISCIHEANLPPQAVAPALSLTDVLTARKDITLILSHLGSYIDFGSPEGVSPPLIALRRARRLFGLLSSFLVDENEALPPGELVFKTTGLPPSSQSRVPNQVDLALDALVRTAVPDVNRRVLGLALSETHLWTLVTALVRRLPVAEIDYTLLDPASGPHAGQWLAYVEKLLLALHSILFSTTPAFKKRVARSAKLALPRTLLRLVRRWTAMTDATLPSMQGTGHGHGHGRPDLRQLYATGAMRAVEVLHVVDDAVDEYGAVDGAAASSATLLTFGMGYGEGAENDLKPGTGLLGGYQEEVALSIMMMRDLEGSMFHELESLVRVE
jgi:SWI/SNF chromatin-remodeling complex subunit SWI1